MADINEHERFIRFKGLHRDGVLAASNGNGGLPVMVVKSAGKFSVREGVVYVILAAALAFGFQSWWRGQDQHDEIIRLQTKLEMQGGKNSEMDSRIAEARATAQIADKNAARLEGKFDQFSLQYTIANPKKSVAPVQ